LLERAPWDRLERYQAFCDNRGVTMLDATFAWLLARPGVTSVIAGATSADQIRQNADAASAWACSPEDAAAINDIFPA
jgi:aryl-alcohol dehydrogenase-like predicted oxidoreductase